MALLVVWFAALIQRAAGARLQTDECFHATMAERIAALGHIPHAIPELYGGFACFYPPLFHVLGALWIKAFGADAFRYVNVFVTGLLVLWIAIALRAPAERTARRWAILLCIGNGWLALHALRLYVEQLSALLAVGTVLLALEVRRDPRRRTVLALGLAAGLGVLSKQSSLLLVALLGGLAAGYFLRRERVTARAFATAAGVSLLLAAPLFVRNWVAYGSPIYPALAPDRHPLLYELNRRVFTPDPLDFYKATAFHTGWAIGIAALAAFALAAWRRRGSLELTLLGVCAALYLAGPLQPFLDPRHMLPVIAVAAVLGAIALARMLEAWTGWRAAIGVALILMAARSMMPMPNYRAPLDLAVPLLEAFEETGRRVPEGETVLSLWTYDTWYYARRPATWPIPWSQPHPPLEMFMTADCDSVMLAFREHRIRYALVPRTTGPEKFDGVNYPGPFVECVQSLLVAGRMELVWMSPTIGLIRVPVADSLPAR